MSNSDFTAAIAPAYVSLVVDGREWRFSVLRLSDHAAAAAEMARLAKAPRAAIKDLAADLDEIDRTEIIRLAWRDVRSAGSVSLDDVLEWYETPAGKLYSWWLKLRRQHPEVTLEEVDELTAKLAEAQVLGDSTDGLPPATPTAGNPAAPDDGAASKSHGEQSAVA